MEFKSQRGERNAKRWSVSATYDIIPSPINELIQTSNLFIFVLFFFLAKSRPQLCQQLYSTIFSDLVSHQIYL